MVITSSYSRPVVEKEGDGPDDAGCKRGADAHHIVAMAQAAQHLRVHALERVRAEDGRHGAREGAG